jgi:methyl-accepting chemotaxis protein
LIRSPEWSGPLQPGALEFRDTKVAQEILATLADEENITAAVIYDRERRPFVQYVRADPTGSPVAFTPPAPLSDGHDFTTTHLSLFRRITSRGERIGIIYLESDLSELSGRLHQYVQIVLWVLLASWFVALILSVRLQRVIVNPILALAGTAKKVSAEKDYGLRVKVQSRDELGQLMTTFNEMLQQIQERDAALQRANR